MNTAIRICVALTAVLSAALNASEPRPKITVVIYNYAAISPEVLAQAEAEAARIYQQCSIKIRWLDCPLRPGKIACQVSSEPTWLVLRILSIPRAARIQETQQSFGSALFPDDGSFGLLADVFANDAKQLAQTCGILPGVFLGHLAAHEIGHLLLGPKSHSSNGIMERRWRSEDLQKIARGLMRFEPEEAGRMRANIQARMAGQEAAMATVVRRASKDDD